VKVLACGSRDVDPFDSWDAFESRLRQLSDGDVTVISGGARGSDAIAHRVAKMLGCRTMTFRAQWERDGRAAGILRNVRMLDQAPDLVLAFWDGKSRGTKHTIDEARRRGIPVEILGRPTTEET